MNQTQPLQQLTLEQSQGGDAPPAGWTARFPGAKWLPWMRCLRTGTEQAAQEQNTEEEALLLVLTGTHDLQAGGGHWRARGLREDVFGARPSALFLPPMVRWQATGGTGELLLCGATQPTLPEPDPAEEAPKKKPLLALAGSGKAFDPGSMEWKPQESFPNAPEALLPRRIETRELPGGARCERVMPLDYKALTLTVDEIVVPDGAIADLGALLAADGGREEAMLFLRCEGEADLRSHGSSLAVSRDAVVGALRPDQLTVGAKGGRVYAAVASGGAKPQT